VDRQSARENLVTSLLNRLVESNAEECLTNMYYDVVMGEIPVRMLNQETAKVLARVKQGEEIDITERGVVVARLVPAEPSPAARLLATSSFRPPRTTTPLAHPKGEVRSDHESGELLERLRDEERY
jgi:prevent-host-death family protein